MAGIGMRVYPSQALESAGFLRQLVALMESPEAREAIKDQLVKPLDQLDKKLADAQKLVEVEEQKLQSLKAEQEKINAQVAADVEHAKQALADQRIKQQRDLEAAVKKANAELDAREAALKQGEQALQEDRVMLTESSQQFYAFAEETKKARREAEAVRDEYQAKKAALTAALA